MPTGPAAALSSASASHVLQSCPTPRQRAGIPCPGLTCPRCPPTMQPGLVLGPGPAPPTFLSRPVSPAWTPSSVSHTTTFEGRIQGPAGPWPSRWPGQQQDRSLSCPLTVAHRAQVFREHSPRLSGHSARRPIPFPVLGRAGLGLVGAAMGSRCEPPGRRCLAGPPVATHLSCSGTPP